MGSKHTFCRLGKLGIQGRIVVEVVVLLLIVLPGQAAGIAVHHVALHSVQAGKLAGGVVIPSRPHRHVPVLQLGTLRGRMHARSDTHCCN